MWFLATKGYSVFLWLLSVQKQHQLLPRKLYPLMSCSFFSTFVSCKQRANYFRNLQLRLHGSLEGTQTKTWTSTCEMSRHPPQVCLLPPPWCQSDSRCRSTAAGHTGRPLPSRCCCWRLRSTRRWTSCSGSSPSAWPDSAVEEIFHFLQPSIHPRCLFSLNLFHFFVFFSIVIVIKHTSHIWT